MRMKGIHQKENYVNSILNLKFNSVCARAVQSFNLRLAKISIPVAYASGDKPESAH